MIYMKIYVSSYAPISSRNISVGYVVYRKLKQVHSGGAYFRSQLTGRQEGNYVAILFSLYDILENTKLKGPANVIIDDKDIAEHLFRGAKSVNKHPTLYQEYCQKIREYAKKIPIDDFIFSIKLIDPKLKEAHAVAKDKKNMPDLTDKFEEIKAGTPI